MPDRAVSLRVPAEAGFARCVRMMAANLAVLCGMSVDGVEDVRMAAEEGFVYSCSTAPTECRVDFSMGEGGISMDFSLGTEAPAEGGDDEASQRLDLVELLLSAVCEDFGVSEDGRVLHLSVRVVA